MKNHSNIFVILLFFLTSESLFGQAYQNSWGFGFGVSYPRFFSTNSKPGDLNRGAGLSLQRNFSENVALRLYGNYDYIEGKTPDHINMYTNLANGYLDLLYYLVPCSSVDPYFGWGVGIAYFKPVWYKSQVKPMFAPQYNILLGSDWKIAENWKLNTEFGFHLFDGELDGTFTPSRQGIFSSNMDAYFAFNLGLVYYFDKGAKSKYCDLYNGITVQIPKDNYPTLKQIDSLIIAHIPKEVVKQVVVEKRVEVPVTKQVAEKKKSWVVHGIYFRSNSSELMPESFPILLQEKQNLLDNPEMKIEVQGYTDNVGTDAKNKKLSQDRANAVRDYLIRNGIDPDRLTAVGFGKANPVADNRTEKGRAENRRIEFKVIK